METIKSSSAKISENSSTTTSNHNNNNHMGNGGLSSAFDRDSILRRTTENSSSLGVKRFEDIKKRYATKGGSSGADDSCGDKENNTVKQPTAKKMNLFTSLFKESSSPSEIIASKRDLFFKNHHHHNANPQQQHHSTLPSQGTTTTTPLPINSNGNAFSSPLPSSPSTLSNPSPPISSTTRHQNRSATMPVNTVGSSTTCGTAPPKGSSSYDYYGSDREKPLSSYLSSVSKIGSSSASSAQHPGSRFTPSNYSSSNLSGGGPSKSQDSVTTTTTLPTSTKISNLINKVNSGTTHLNAISDDDEDEDCVDSTTTMTHRNNLAGFATELANKKKQLFPPSQQKCSTVGRMDSSSSPPPSVLSASVISGGAAIQPVTGPASNKISAFAANINNNNNNNFHSGIYPSSVFATSNSPSPINPTTQSHFVINGAQNQLISDQNNNGPPIAIVDKCIGFANLPNQFYRRAVKRGFEFTLMLVGESGLGKSTLINTLFLSDIYSDEHPGPSQRLKKTVEVETSKQILVENGVQMTLTVVDTPGFGDSVDNSACWQKILNHIENKYEEYLREESRINRKSFEDSRIHLCLYFIAPSGHGLKEIDIEFMKKLHEKVNILPLVAKADTMTPEEINKFKRRILNEIRQNNINIYEFPCMDDPEENRRNQELKDKVPFAVMGSNTMFDINNRRVRGRKYAWGIAEVDNADHCDFSALRDMLIRRHMQHMKDVTANVLYENYRCYKLSGGHPDSISDTDNSPLTQLIEEKKDYEDNLAKTEREMEHVFSAKVKEKKDKIRESEAELEKRYEQMKRNLEEQFRELEERRRNFEAEKHAWENGIPLVGHPQHLNGGGNQQQQQQQFLSHHHSHQGLNNVSNGNTHPISDMNRNDSNSYLNAQGGGAQHMSSYNNGVTSSNNIMSSNSTLNSVTSNKKGVPQYNDTAMKEVYDEKEKKKEKKRFF